MLGDERVSSGPAERVRAMADDALHAVLRDAERRRPRFVFADGGELLAEVVNTSHVDADGTVVLLRVGAVAGEGAWQVQLADIRSVATPDGHSLYKRSEPAG